MTRLETLKKLESKLECFIDRVVASEVGRIEALRQIDTLDDIARDSLRGRHINTRLGRWLAENNRGFVNERFDRDHKSRIGALFNEIRSGLDSADFESRKLVDEIDSWRDKGIVPKRKLVLKIKPEIRVRNIATHFQEFMSKESEYIEAEFKRSPHLLSILDDVLKSADAKSDPMFLHLAGSIVYYLKINGYKIGPYVKRLKQIEQSRAEKVDAS